MSAVVGMLGYAVVKNRRGKIIAYQRRGISVRLNTWGEEGAKAWIATAPGISACGPSPEAAIYVLRERATRALELTK